MLILFAFISITVHDGSFDFDEILFLVVINAVLRTVRCFTRIVSILNSYLRRIL